MGQEISVPMKYERIPPGELAIRYGTRAEAADGHVGRVDGFLVDPTNGQMTHVILRRGSLWGRSLIRLPASGIARIEKGAIHLSLDKHGIWALAGTWAGEPQA
jgi:hypothetical protein